MESVIKEPMEVLCEMRDTRQFKKLYLIMYFALYNTNLVFQDIVKRYPLVKTINNLMICIDTSHFSANQVNNIVVRLIEVLGKLSNKFEVELGNDFEYIEIEYNAN